MKRILLSAEGNADFENENNYEKYDVTGKKL